MSLQTSRSSDTEDGLLSFSNPSYQLDPEDVNSNLDSVGSYGDIYQELETVCKLNRRSGIKSRRNYAQLDPVSMGVAVDLDTSPMLASDSDNNLKEGLQSMSVQGKLYHTIDNESAGDVDSNYNRESVQQSGFLDYYMSLETALCQSKGTSPVYQAVHSSGSTTNGESALPARNEKETNAGSRTVKAMLNSVPLIQSSATGDLTKTSEKKNPCYKDQQMPSLYNIPKKHSSNNNAKRVSLNDVRETDTLPSGWEKHEDESGPYYWHISSGTIQREPPLPCSTNCKSSAQIAKDIDMIASFSDFSLSRRKICPPATSAAVSETTCNAPAEYKRRSYPERTCGIMSGKRPVRFAVRSLGWVEIAEEDLTPEKSSKAVNKCIVDLSFGRNDILDVVGRWGDGKDLFMDLDDDSLCLMDTQDLTILNTQPIHAIRVWGVGRDNGRDFAYVARDRETRKYMCHVFRCDIPARIIANTLRDICKKIMIEKSVQQNLAKQVGPVHESVTKSSSLSAPTRPTSFPTEQQQFLRNDSQSSSPAQSFPTPMEEPKKMLKVHYLGTVVVSKATGVDVLNDAIEQLSASVPLADYKFVSVAVAPSTITILEPGEGSKVLEECRVRFLSFLGIGRNVKYCGFIVHTAQDKFVAHVFYCEPSSGALCKTIEAACKLRYQKCLDAHRKIQEKNASDPTGSKGLATTIRSILGSISRIAKNVDT